MATGESELEEKKKEEKELTFSDKTEEKQESSVPGKGDLSG